MTVAIQGWDTLADRVERELTDMFRSMAIEMHAAVADRTINGAGDGGSPVASGRLSASNVIGLNQPNTWAAPEDPSYIYPPASVHRFNRANLPPPTIAPRAAGYAARRLRAFRVGDSVYISNSTPYAMAIETGRHSWQKPAGFMELSIRKLFKDRGW